MAPQNTHEQFVRQAIALAGKARDDGNHPFGALLVVDGQVALTATNSVVTDRDSTGHAETNLVAHAIRHLSPDQIGHAVLYTSCEPCAMCVGKIYWAGIRSVVYALSAQELAVLAGPDFLVPCRDLFQRAIEAVAVVGPMLVDEARAVHIGFWPKPSAQPALAANVASALPTSPVHYHLASRDGCVVSHALVSAHFHERMDRHLSSAVVDRRLARSREMLPLDWSNRRAAILDEERRNAVGRRLPRLPESGCRLKRTLPVRVPVVPRRSSTTVHSVG
jgi:tRNA(Arg) A34 adenosine deaminase TadA